MGDATGANYEQFVLTGPDKASVDNALRRRRRARGGTHDVAGAARFLEGLITGDSLVRGAEGRVPLCLSHDVCLRIFNQT
jgi:hypothetical protein